MISYVIDYVNSWWVNCIQFYNRENICALCLVLRVMLVNEFKKLFFKKYNFFYKSVNTGNRLVILNVLFICGNGKFVFHWAFWKFTEWTDTKCGLKWKSEGRRYYKSSIHSQPSTLEYIFFLNIWIRLWENVFEIFHLSLIDNVRDLIFNILFIEAFGFEFIVMLIFIVLLLQFSKLNVCNMY